MTPRLAQIARFGVTLAVTIAVTIAGALIYLPRSVTPSLRPSK